MTAIGMRRCRMSVTVTASYLKHEISCEKSASFLHATCDSFLSRTETCISFVSEKYFFSIFFLLRVTSEGHSRSDFILGDGKSWYQSYEPTCRCCSSKAAYLFVFSTKSPEFPPHNGRIFTSRVSRLAHT